MYKKEPKVKNQRVRQRMLLFQKQEILRLRWGSQEFDVNDPGQQMQKHNTISQIARIVGVKASAVAMFLYRYKKDGLIARKKVKTGHIKVPAHIA